MIKSSLAKNYTLGFNNYSSRHGAKLDRIVVHHMAGAMTNQQCKQAFLSRTGSATYCIDKNGEIGCFVSEEYRPWTTSTAVIDNRAITIEVANCGGAPDWKVSDSNLSLLVELLVDICKRNDIKSLRFIDGDRNNSVLQAHRWWAATACPGDYLYSKFPWIAQTVTERLGGSEVTERKITIDSNECFDSYHNGQKIVVFGCPDGYEVGVETAKQAGVDNWKALQTVDKIDYDGVVNAFKMNGGYFHNVPNSIDYGLHYGVEIGYESALAPKSNVYAVYAQLKDGTTIADTADNFWYGQSEVQFAISPAVIIYHNGAKVNIWSSAYSGSKAIATQQTMLIRTNDRFVGAICTGKLTPAQCAEWAQYIVGLQDLILLDSGGSTSAIGWDVKTKKEVVRFLTGRKIANAIVFAKPIKASDEAVSEEKTASKADEKGDSLKPSMVLADEEKEALKKENETLHKTNDALAEELKEEKAVSAKYKEVMVKIKEVLSEMNIGD